MSQDYTRELQVAASLARKAAAAIMEHYAADFEVQYKGKGESDPVTQADKDANEIIVAGLTEAFPDDGLLAEESPASAARLSKQRLWCIDPLDGTREFVDKNGQFVVMIGLAIEGVAKAGVVLQPTEDLMWLGAEGMGAFEERRSGERVPVAVTDNRSASRAVMMVSRSHRSKTVTRIAETMGIQREMPMGSVGLKASRITLGVADVYISMTDRTQEWDACAPHAILEAAGGRMTDVMGRPLVYNKEGHNTPFGMLASNGHLHPAAVAAIAPIVKERGWA